MSHLFVRKQDIFENLGQSYRENHTNSPLKTTIPGQSWITPKDGGKCSFTPLYIWYG